MPLFGAHLSIAGGTDRAALRARGLGADCLQLFVKSPSQWRFAALTDEEVERFRAAVRGEQQSAPGEYTGGRTRNEHNNADERNSPHGPPCIHGGLNTDAADAASVTPHSALRTPHSLSPLVGHASYLVNLASPDDRLYDRSRRCLLEELDRAARLGLDAFVLHPGAHVGSGEQAGLDRIADALLWLRAARPAPRVSILLETTAGAGTVLGGRFEQLAYVINKCDPTAKDGNRQEATGEGRQATGNGQEAAGKGAAQSEIRNLKFEMDSQNGLRSVFRVPSSEFAVPSSAFWLGICIDTCHLFAAGYDLRTAASLDSTLGRLDAAVGLDRVCVVHANDSRGRLGSRLDRHAHIGRGQLGRATFRLLVNHPALCHLPFIIETPKEDDRGRAMDPVNLRTLRRMAAT